MLSVFDFARELNILGITTRLVLAVLCGGVIGIEREYKRRPAGFRTHILLCLGAAITTLTSQYLLLEQHMFTDVSRLGAQVIAGVGFIGAGTIIVTKHQRIKGLTTAAGMWTAAIIGLVCGSGFVECAVVATVMVLVAEVLLIKIETRYARRIKNVNLYIEYKHSAAIENIIKIFNERHVAVEGLEISRIAGEGEDHHYCAVMTIHSSRTKLDEDLICSVNAVEDVITLEEL